MQVCSKKDLCFLDFFRLSLQGDSNKFANTVRYVVVRMCWTFVLKNCFRGAFSPKKGVRRGSKILSMEKNKAGVNVRNGQSI